MAEQTRKEALPSKSRLVLARSIQETSGFDGFTKSFLQRLLATSVAASIQIRNHFRSNRTYLIVAVIFTLVLFIAETWFFRNSYYNQGDGGNYLTNVFTFFPSHIFLHIAAIIASLFLSGCYLYAALSSSVACRLAYFAIFVIAVVAEYTSQATLGRFSDAEDIRLFILVTNLEMQTTAVKMFFSWSPLLTCLAFAGVLIFFRHPARKTGLRTLLFTVAGVFGFYLLVARYGVLQANYMKYPVASINAFARTFADYTWTSAHAYTGERETVEIAALPSLPAKNIVFVVDESVRGDHLSINDYKRETTPYLKELAEKGALLNWGIASSLTTCSDSSDMLLMTGLSSQDLPDANHKAKKLPTIFQYAKALGYRTYYFDGQMNSFWSLKTSDMRYVDEWWNLNRILQHNNDYRLIDHTIAEAVNNLITRSQGNFIWIIKAGAHVPYYKHYTENETVWTPAYTQDGWPVDKRQELVNAYDNAIRHNVDGFFRKLVLNHQAPADTTIVYTSDHGETLAENGERTPHCSTTKNETKVPLFIIGYEAGKVDTKYKASHPNIFATVLDLMGVPEQSRKHPYARSLLKAREADSEPRFYAGPNLQSSPRFKFDE